MKKIILTFISIFIVITLFLGVAYINYSENHENHGSNIGLYNQKGEEIKEEDINYFIDSEGKYYCPNGEEMPKSGICGKELGKVNPRSSFINDSDDEVSYIDHLGNIHSIGNITFNTSGAGYGFFQYLGIKLNPINWIRTKNITISDIANVSNEIYINEISLKKLAYNMSHAIPWDYNQTSGSIYYYNFTGTGDYYYNMTNAPPYDYNQTSSSGWRKSGTNVFLDTLTDSVGIGTASPTAVLDVKGNLNVSGGINITSGDLTLIDGGLNVSGNIGIGRNSYDLDVWRDTGDAVLRLRSGTGEDAAIQLQTPAANQDYKIYVDEDDSQSLKIDRWHDSAWNNKITLTTGDKFALGTTKPQYQFQIESASPYIYINDTTSSNYATLIGQINDIFSINRIGSGGNDIQIQADGDIILAGTTGDYIGIGTTSPTHTLTVSGDVNISGNLTSRMASFGKGVPQKWFLINSSYTAGDFKGAAVKGSAGSNTFGALAYCAGGTPPTVYGVYGKNGTISQQKYAGYFDGHIYVDGELISGSACGVPSGTFSAEESGGLDATSYEWSFGNGVALDDAGIVQPCQGVITAMSVQCDSCIGTTSTVEVQIDNAGTSCETDIDTAGGGGGTYGFDSSCTDSFSAGDNLNFYTIDDDGACTSCVATMWVRYR